MTLEELIVKRDELVATLATGAKSYRHGDTAKENQDAASLLKALSAINDMIATLQGTATPRRTVASYSSGLR